MYAQNVATGETFTGRYTGHYREGGLAMSQGMGTYSGISTQPGSTPIYTSGTIATTSATFVPPTSADAGGILIGTKGTVIEVYLDITPGIVPSGVGTGIDNAGNRYQIQF